ncbi:MAG: DUF4215 domain-containing protein [Sandaracinaceae bacterium]|nr:DUF4215 domain-containing protein [Sandaracinaceae bacterium]
MRALAWGTLVALALCGCDGETMTGEDGGVDASTMMDAGPAPVCGNGRVEPGEACDDGNTTGGDGCSADCTSNETCGNGVRDPGEVCDDGNTTGGDGCSAGCDSDESCGNGIVDFAVGEECDDENSTPGDGCHECRSETCSTAEDCDDDDPCNGEESCGAGGECIPGARAADGTTCGDGTARELCVAGACRVSACGDGYLDTGATPPEQCDDGGTTGGDGCDPSCQLEPCTSVEQCDDANVCTAGHACTDGFCVLGTHVSNGTLCDADMSPATRDICLRGRCQRSVCGDGYVDVAEQCDDGNTTSGDGCEADCTFPIVPPSGFRVTSLSQMDPHFYAPLGPTCSDITNALNIQLRQFIDDFMLNAVGVWRPLDIARPTNPMEIHFGASCGPGTPRAVCGPWVGGGTVVGTTANNMRPATSVCMRADPAHLNPTYTSPINVASGPCFVSDEQTFIVGFGGTNITLTDGQMAGTFVGGAMPPRIVNGVIRGFLSEEQARMITFDEGIPLVGGDSLYQHLAAGGEAGSACDEIATFTTDDRDMHDGVRGFWFYMNFEAERVDWTP